MKNIKKLNEWLWTCYWLPFLKDELKADEYSILIGHSSGSIAALRFAEENNIVFLNFLKNQDFQFDNIYQSGRI